MTTATYQASVKARGWIYLPQLPPNTKLGALVAGAPGARSPWSPTGSRYEVAPALVLVQEGFTRSLSALLGTVEAYAIDNPLGLSTLDEDRGAFTKGVSAGQSLAVKAAEAVGLDHGIAGLVAKGLGVQPWMLLVALALWVYVYFFRKVVTV